MSTLSQILTITGLLLEFLAVAYTAREVFPTKSRAEMKMRYIEKLGKTIDQKIESRAEEWFTTLGLLAIGMFLQAIAIFI